MSEPSDYEFLKARIRALREEVAPRLKALREQGFEVDSFLEDCDRMTAFIDGHGEPGFDADTFADRMTAYIKEYQETMHLHQQAEVVRAVESLPGTVEMLMEAASSLRAHGGPGEVRMAAEMEANVAEMRRRLDAGEVPLDEIQSASLLLNAQTAELNRRSLIRNAATMLYWEKQTPEWWARLSPEKRATVEGLLEQWRVERESILSELPLEDRRRLEAMTLEDFDRPSGGV